MYSNVFIQAGLSKNEALIYEFLLKNGQSPVSEITKNTPLNKGVVYLALNELTNKGLVVEKKLAPDNPNVRNKKKIAFFSPEHPEKFKEYLDNQKAAIKQAQKNLEANFGDIISGFNLISGKPGIKFYEGMEGVKKVIMDSLTAKEEIYTYADAEAVVKNIAKINNEYVKERNRLGLKKKMILPDSAYNKNYLKDYHNQVTDTKFINHEKFPFTSVMQIYDNKVSYINFAENYKIGIIIENKAIYQMQRNLFKFVWENASDVN